MRNIVKSVYRALVACVLAVMAGAFIDSFIEAWNTDPNEVHSTLLVVCRLDDTCCENTRAAPITAMPSPTAPSSSNRNIEVEQDREVVVLAQFLS